MKSISFVILMFSVASCLDHFQDQFLVHTITEKRIERQ